MNLHPMALTITLLIMAEQRQHTTFEYAIYEVLNQYMVIKEWPEEKRADLYAQLAEKLNAKSSMIHIEQVVSDSLFKTEERFNG